ncbi:MAG: type II toxin-antitoxin system mRNA interferase toxin, RelE/StbE family [Chloroflexi bacterium CG_4_9_14_3_um_filter_45_9]|nr:MAG: type II toxin-antitoxin system mRNA interferase toxin, RelE/StbE family [Chloroflexi bacterium CG_4_9_14_3_um_filter_45_9]
MYKVELRRRVQDKLDSLPESDREMVMDALISLEENPRPRGMEKIRGKELWRVRKGDYRVVYDIDDDAKIVTVVRIGHRKDVYHGL